jgi:hypothetical protein
LKEAEKVVAMLDKTLNMKWDPVVREKYDNMVRRIPFFHREIAKQIVEKKAMQNAHDRGSALVDEGDVMRAFFSEVPKAFYSMMVRLSDDAGFDSRRYESK